MMFNALRRIAAPTSDVNQLAAQAPICGCVGHLQQRVAGTVYRNPDQPWTARHAFGLQLTGK